MASSITHENGLRRTTRDVAQFYDQIAHLRPKLRAVLVQLPASLEFSARTVNAFFRTVPSLRGTAVACEPRNSSWFSEKADAILRNLNVTRVAADPVRCDGAGNIGGARGFAYFRWHGAPHVYYSQYSDARLQAFAAHVAHTRAKEAWCIFDNTALHAAWGDALRFRHFLNATLT